MKNYYFIDLEWKNERNNKWISYENGFYDGKLFPTSLEAEKYALKNLCFLDKNEGFSINKIIETDEKDNITEIEYIKQITNE